MNKQILSVVLLFFSLSSVCQSIDSLNKILDYKTVITKKTISLAGKKSVFTVETGYLPWKNDNNEIKANIFFTSYIKDGEAEQKRPICIAFNGGPGSSSLWLHLGCLGPKRIEMDAIGNAPAPPYKLLDNDYSWLDLTDIIFIDPVGTGFSRPTKGEKEAQFYGYQNDVSAIGECVRLLLNKYKRWGSPKYILGESYGTTRAAGLSKYLIDEHGIYLNGLILMSSALDFETIREYENNDLAFMSYLPSYTASAFYHKKLKEPYSQDLQKTLNEVENFVINEYSVALYKGNLITDNEKDNIAKKISNYIGLSKDYILKSNLRIPSWRYRKILLNDSSQSIGRFDSRLTMNETDMIDDDCSNDASFTKIRAAFSTSINYYLRSELKYNNDLPYTIIGNVSPWEYANGKYLNVVPSLSDAMIQNTDMKVWIISGLYDLATPYFGTVYALNHATIPSVLNKNITTTIYNAGHMMYLSKPCLEQLKKDAIGFFDNGKK